MSKKETTKKRESKKGEITADGLQLVNLVIPYYPVYKHVYKYAFPEALLLLRKFWVMGQIKFLINSDNKQPT